MSPACTTAGHRCPATAHRSARFHVALVRSTNHPIPVNLGIFSPFRPRVAVALCTPACILSPSPFVHTRSVDVVIIDVDSECGHAIILHSQRRVCLCSNQHLQLVVRQLAGSLHDAARQDQERRVQCQCLTVQSIHLDGKEDAACSDENEDEGGERNHAGDANIREEAIQVSEGSMHGGVVRLLHVHEVGFECNLLVQRTRAIDASVHYNRTLGLQDGALQIREHHSGSCDGVSNMRNVLLDLEVAIQLVHDH
mmetsp:Transcript_16559/g.52821  ORF Transcript_16559/g.52821 Transcript_16559/m.52821 type:complete len:253 (+) Transcript_16559:1043-1801(+)